MGARQLKDHNSGSENVMVVHGAWTVRAAQARECELRRIMCRFSKY